VPTILRFFNINMKKTNRIYLDVCVLSRPYDDQSFLRIRIETAAANLILAHVKRGEFDLIVSPVHIEEILSISDLFERIELQERLAKLAKPVTLDLNAVKERAEELCKLNFGIADAAHVAYAEKCNSDFISCDDALIKRCSKHNIRVWCGNPIAFCEREHLK
jgi:predicted nucleic acid-binding protein